MTMAHGAPTSPTSGDNADEIYIHLVSRAGLFGKAFFGHRTTKREARQLNRLWKLAQKMSTERDESEGKES